MSDLAEQLRIEADEALPNPDIIIEAADLIEQLQQRNAELEQREQELTATVERLRDAAKHVLNIHGIENIDGIRVLSHAVRKTPQQNLAEHDKELLTRFAQFLNERCDLHVANMVRPFLEQDK